MKTPILALAAFLLTVTSYGQTLKWTQTPPEPGFTHDLTNLVHMRADTFGNVAVCVDYNFANAFVSTQAFWISAAGKIIKSDILAAQQGSARVLTVSATLFVISYVNDQGNTVLRKYSKRGSLVSFTDTELSQNESSPASQEIVTTGKFGFFMRKFGPTGFMELKYYKSK